MLKNPNGRKNPPYQQEYETKDKPFKINGKNSDDQRQQQNKHQQKIHYKTNGRDMSVVGHNRFDVLEVHGDDEPDEGATGDNWLSTPNKKENHSTVILGDSMIRGLRKDKISKSVKQSVKAKCFSGATCDDMGIILNHL